MRFDKKYIFYYYIVYVTKVNSRKCVGGHVY